MSSVYFPDFVHEYIFDIVGEANRVNVSLCSILVFGSAAKNDFSAGNSDVDLLIVTNNPLSKNKKDELVEAIKQTEIRHGFKKPAVRKGILEKFVDRSGGNDLSFFVCSKADLLSADTGRILSLNRFESMFVNRIVLASILIPSRTIWGEELKPSLHIMPIRRIDVIKAFFSFIQVLILIICTYPILSNATKHAMGVLKRAVHSCYICFHLKADVLQNEAGYFERLTGLPVLKDLIVLRSQYRSSFSFVLSCVRAIVTLHWLTLRKNNFPKSIPINITVPELTTSFN